MYDFQISFQIASAAELVIHIPGSLGQEGVVYRLDYYPPFGYPAPNTTIASKDIRDVIKFSQALPGTKYDFWLYYSNATHNTLTWTANFTTGKNNYLFRIIIEICFYDIWTKFETNSLLFIILARFIYSALFHFCLLYIPSLIGEDQRLKKMV